ncbi:MAG: hypothetical protein RR293_01085 [Bacteroidales bacterium]
MGFQEVFWFFMILGIVIAAALAFFAISKAVSRRKITKRRRKHY